jgi:hypothetical protein
VNIHAIRTALQRQHTSAAIEILCTFGLDDLTDRLTTVGKPASASGVHILVNILSLNPILHAHFDALNLFLEPAADGEVEYFHIPALCDYRHITGRQI